MALIASQKSSVAGLNPAFVAAAGGGDTFQNTGNEQVHVKAGGTGCVVTFVAQNPCNHGVLHNASVTVPANETRVIGPFRDTNRWNNGSGVVSMTYDSVTSITVAVVSD